MVCYVMDMEIEKWLSSCSDTMMMKREIEAAETLAHLAHFAMRERRFTTHSPTPPPKAEADAGKKVDEKICTGITKPVETERIQKVEQDLPKITTYTSVQCSKSRRNLTEEEKEARRMRRVLANRESARQTIRRRQALCEELTRKAANLAVENQNLNREKDLAFKEYQSLENTNKHLKAQIAKTIKTEVEKTSAEADTSVAGVTTLSSNGNCPWILHNRFPVTQLFWPSVIPSSNPVQLQHTPFNSIAIPSNVPVPCSSESDLHHKQNNLMSDNKIPNPLYMFPCPWLFPLPEFGSAQPQPQPQPQPSIGLKDRQDELPLGKQCSSCSSLSTVANVDHQASLPIKHKTETFGWTEDMPINDPANATSRFPLDGVDAVAAAEARKRRKELTKLKSIHIRHPRMQC